VPNAVMPRGKKRASEGASQSQKKKPAAKAAKAAAAKAPKSSTKKAAAAPKRNVVESEEESEDGEDEDDEDDDSSQSQMSQSTQMSQASAIVQSNKHLSKMSAREKQTQIAAMTRLCIFKTMSARAGASNCISYQDLAKVNGDHSKATAALLEETNDRLRQLFGYELRELPASESKQEPALQLDKSTAGGKRTKVYSLFNVLPQATAPDTSVDWSARLPKLGLLMSVLSFIYASKGEMKGDALWAALKKLGVQKGKKHAVFGTDVESFVEKDLVSQKYLMRIKIVEAERQTFDYRWGQRARAEFSERDVLSFMAEIYGEDVEKWLEKLGKNDDDEDDAIDEEDESECDCGRHPALYFLHRFSRPHARTRACVPTRH